LLNNLSVIEKLQYSLRILREEVSALLNNLEEDLIQREWWDDNLISKRQHYTQLYISSKKWTADEKNYIWVGIEFFTVEGLFGSEKPPQCYLWVSGNREIIMSDLAKLINNDALLKNYYKGSGGYVLIKPLKKITNISDVQIVGDYVEEEIANFIENIYLCIKDYEIDFNFLVDNKQ
jgi:hypothetical protein